MSLAQNFYDLGPDVILAGVEAAGFRTTGEYIQLNSYENRVFDIKLESEPGRLIAKYYRPARWTKEQILEEHQFLHDLKSQGLQTVEAVKQKNGSTVSEYQGIYLGLFPKIQGRLPQEFFKDDFKKIGRAMAQLHNIGAQKKAVARPRLTTEEYGWPAIEILQQWVAPETWQRYQRAAEDILFHLDEALDPKTFIRIHGDAHKGNLLMTDRAGEDKQFFFVDFDDFVMGPEAQDFWMLLAGSDEEEKEIFIDAYKELREFPFQQMDLLEPLRGLRILHYGAWIARRWEDPTFPHLFPQFTSYSYWAEETEALERIAWALD